MTRKNRKSHSPRSGAGSASARKDGGRNGSDARKVTSPVLAVARADEPPRRVPASSISLDDENGAATVRPPAPPLDDHDSDGAGDAAGSLAPTIVESRTGALAQEFADDRELDDDWRSFFRRGAPSAAETAWEDSEDALDIDYLDARLRRKMSPEVQRRRESLARYVQGAVALSVAICLGAIVRGRPAANELPYPAAAAMVASVLPQEPAATAEAPGAVTDSVVTLPTMVLADNDEAPEPVAAANPSEASSTKAPVAAAAPAKAADLAPARAGGDAPQISTPGASASAAPSPAIARAVPSAIPSAAIATAPPAPPPAQSAPPVVHPVAADRTAAQEKRDAQKLLERGAYAKAIEAGERSVALDPTDGEAWLLLGAAYQETGKVGEARRCFSSCVRRANRGPLGECRALMR